MTREFQDEDTIDKRPPLDRWRADAILTPDRPVWGLEAIGRVLGLSRDTVRRLAQDPRVPISKPEGAGSYFAWRSELITWLRTRSPDQR